MIYRKCSNQRPGRLFKFLSERAGGGGGGGLTRWGRLFEGAVIGSPVIGNMRLTYRTNVDFKLCRSWWDDHTTSWKVETSISEAKIVRIEAESLKIFPSRPEKWANGLSFFALEGKIEQQIRISARKRPRGLGLSKQQCPALTSSIESYDKYLKIPQKR